MATATSACSETVIPSKRSEPLVWLKSAQLLRWCLHWNKLGLTGKCTAKRLVEQCGTVELAFGSLLCEPDILFRMCIFRVRRSSSLMTTLYGRPPLEMGLI